MEDTKTKKYLMWFDGCLIFAMIVVFVFIMSEYRDMRLTLEDQKSTIKEILLANTEVINEVGRAHQKLAHSTDIMLRYNHYLDRHDPTQQRVKFCPECSIGLPLTTDPYGNETELPVSNHTEEFPATLDQVKKDTVEIRNGVHTINNSIWSQIILLQSVLKKLRHEKEKEISTTGR